MSATKQDKNTSRKKMEPDTKAAARSESPSSELKVALDSKRDLKERIAALVRLINSICNGEETMPVVLKIIEDRDEPLRLRLTALQVVQTAK